LTEVGGIWRAKSNTAMLSAQKDILNAMLRDRTIWDQDHAAARTA
jgi:hypothetical protein